MSPAGARLNALLADPSVLHIVADGIGADGIEYCWVVNRDTGQAVSVGTRPFCQAFLTAAGNGHTHAWATTIAFWGGRFTSAERRRLGLAS